MQEQEKPKTIFHSISQALRGNKKDVVQDLQQSQDNLLKANPMGDYDANFIQNQQQKFLDLQTLKVSQDIYSRSMYYDSDRISAYNDFRAMDMTPEIAVALDIMSDECIEASTVIPLLNGKKFTVEELYLQNKTSFWVYSYNIDKKCVEPALCERIAYKGEQNVYEVTFDDDSSIMVTDEHLWLLKKDKKYKKTKDLQIGDSIQPFYTKISDKNDRINGYEMILEDSGNWEYTHRIVKRKMYPDSKGVCHHVNFNKLDNEPENLQVMNYFDHQKLHTDLNTERWKNEEFATKMKGVFSSTNKKNGPYWTNEEWSKDRSEAARNHMLSYISKLSEEERKIKFGLPGEKNGMFNNGHKLENEKNGRFRKDLKHEFTIEEIVHAFKNSNSITEACNILQTNEVILRKSKTYKNLNIERWEDLDFYISGLTIENLKSICLKYQNSLILEKNGEKLSKELGVDLQIVNKFLKKYSYKNWTDFVKQFNSKNHILNDLKFLYLQSEPNKFGRITLESFCKQHNKSKKTIDGLISRSQYKTWTSFVSSINHSIKKIEFVGSRKTYDLINVTENNNYAVLTSNGTGVFVHNCVTRSDRGEILSIYSEDTRIKKILKELFFQTLNVNYNLWFWIRELLKYGDNILKLELDQHIGIYNIVQLPIGEIHKEMGYDGNPSSVRFKWENNNLYFEDFQIAHFSLISDGTKMPYGRSILDSGRKIWKQLQLAEDALLVYRLVRAPERRIFFLDVGNLNDTDVRQYIEKMKAEIKKGAVVNQQNGQVSFKFNPITFEEDFFIPLRGAQSPTRVETLPGASNLSDIADIEYLQNKLFTAIKVPKTYLNYGEALPGGSTLSQADLRFSRTINRIQEAVVLELRNIANIHLKILGFDDDLNNFTLTLTNPSTQQEMLKLETMKTKIEVFKQMFTPDVASPVSYAWAMEFILGFSKAEIKQILRQKKVERKMFYEIERAHVEYEDTGLFKELDKKFRRPDFDPDAVLDPENEAGGADDSGGDASFGGGSSFGFDDLDASMGADAAGDDLDVGDDAGAGEPAGAELTGDETDPNLGEQNKLLKKNKIFDNKTKNLLEGIDHFLKKIREEDKPE